MGLERIQKKLDVGSTLNAQQTKGAAKDNSKIDTGIGKPVENVNQENGYECMGVNLSSTTKDANWPDGIPTTRTVPNATAPVADIESSDMPKSKLKLRWHPYRANKEKSYFGKTYVYDKGGFLSEIKDKKGNTIEKIDRTGLIDVVTFTGENQERRATYDPADTSLMKITDIKYGANGKKIQEIQRNEKGKATEVIDYEYYDNSKLKSEIMRDKKGVVTGVKDYRYEVMDNGDNFERIFTYDKDGNLTSYTSIRTFDIVENTPEGEKHYENKNTMIYDSQGLEYEGHSVNGFPNYGWDRNKGRIYYY